jgi:pimeloyl-ACP methyl ester carboxylesterase
LAHAWDQVLGQQAMQKMISRYGEINVLLVLIYGTADRNVPNEQVQRYHLSAPKTSLIEVSGAGHELMFAQPDTLLGGIAKLRNENKLSKQD